MIYLASIYALIALGVFINLRHHFSVFAAISLGLSWPYLMGLVIAHYGTPILFEYSNRKRQ